MTYKQTSDQSQTTFALLDDPFQKKFKLHISLPHFRCVVLQRWTTTLFVIIFEGMQFLQPN
jgi:hypothetical protein